MADSIFTKVARLVIKIGSGLVTQKGGLNLSFLNGLAREVALLRKRNIEVLLVSSGAIACGMDLLGLSRRPHELPKKQAVAALGQPQLINCYSQVFKKKKLRVGQILLTRGDLEDRHRFLTAKHAVAELLKLGVVPIFNENDTVAVEEIQVGDNDQLSAMVAHLMDAQLLVILTDTDGFFDKDPKIHKEAQRIPVVENVDDNILKLAQGTLSAKSTGGMITKLKAAGSAAMYGVPTWMGDGRDPRIISSLFKGVDAGSLFLPRKEALSSRKYWIAYTLKPAGQIIIDDGAVNAIRDSKKSLLPSGIVEVMGIFDIGDAVEITDSYRNPIARGLSSYSSKELEKIKGQKTSEIEKILGYKYYDEVVNRDDLVVL